MVSKDIEIRKFENKYLNGIIELQSSEDRLKYSDDYIKWMTKQLSKDTVGYVALHKKRVVGYFMGIPSQLSVGDKEVIIYHGGPLVHINYRKQRICTKLARKCIIEGEKRHTGLYGFPNRAIFNLLTKKSDFDFLGYTDKMVKPLNTRYILKRKIKNDAVVHILAMFGNFLLNVVSPSQTHNNKKISIRKVKSFDKRINKFWKKASREHEILLVRDRKNLLWRFVMNPQKKYDIFTVEENREVIGYFVLRSVIYNNERYVLIEDIMSLKQEDVVTAIVSNILKYVRKRNTDMIVGHFTDPYYIKILKKFGFFKMKGIPIIIKTHYQDIPKDFFLDKRRWFITSYDKSLS